jgi:hypothetical protein
MIRINDNIIKISNSFFRALSMSLFNNVDNIEYIKSFMKLTLKTNCDIYK